MKTKHKRILGWAILAAMVYGLVFKLLNMLGATVVEASLHALLFFAFIGLITLAWYLIES